MTALEPGSDGVRVRLGGPDGAETIHARRVVLATGREGQAAPRVPGPLAPFLGDPVRHSADDIDFAALSGRRVAVVGLAATAFDNAAVALDAGAAEVVLIGRAPALPRLNKMKQTVYPGFSHGFPTLPDREKLRWLDHVVRQRIAPPRDSVLRISSHPRLRLMLGTEITGARADGEALRLETTRGAVVADRVILGTGFAFDLGAPREIGKLAPEILRWRDRVPEASGEWGECPCLAPDFAFLPRDGSAVEGLGRLHCFTHAAQLSLGKPRQRHPGGLGGCGPARAGHRRVAVPRGPRPHIGAILRTTRSRSSSATNGRGSTPGALPCRSAARAGIIGLLGDGHLARADSHDPPPPHAGGKPALPGSRALEKPARRTLRRKESLSATGMRGYRSPGPAAAMRPILR